MIEDVNERLVRALTGRELEISLSHALEDRVRMWIDRFNAAGEKYGEAALMDPNSDTDLGVAILTLVEDGLQRDESDHGLEGFLWGDVVSRELADEMRRRGAV